MLTISLDINFNFVNIILKGRQNFEKFRLTRAPSYHTLNRHNVHNISLERWDNGNARGRWARSTPFCSCVDGSYVLFETFSPLLIPFRLRTSLEYNEAEKRSLYMFNPFRKEKHNQMNHLIKSLRNSYNLSYFIVQYAIFCL